MARIASTSLALAGFLALSAGVLATEGEKGTVPAATPAANTAPSKVEKTVIQESAGQNSAVQKKERRTDMAYQRLPLTAPPSETPAAQSQGQSTPPVPAEDLPSPTQLRYWKSMGLTPPGHYSGVGFSHGRVVCSGISQCASPGLQSSGGGEASPST